MSAAASTPASQPDFSLATYNVNYGNPDLKDVVASIRLAGADVVALQETNKESEEFIRKELSKTYPHMRFDHAPTAGGLALLSKVPLEGAKYLPPAKDLGGWFGTQLARVTLQGRQLQIVNVHLVATVPKPGTSMIEFLKLYAACETVRDKEIRRLVGQLPKHWPVVMLGDYNSISKISSVLDFMAKSGFADDLAEVVAEADLQPTWHWTIGKEEYKARLDYLFSRQTAARTVSAKVLPSDASDHYLVTCGFKWQVIDVSAGQVQAQARSVAYLLDAQGMPPQRYAAARELVAASIGKLTDDQWLCTVVPGRKDVVLPVEFAMADKDAKAKAVEGLPKDAPKEAPLPPAVQKALSLLADEAAPKAMIVLSDRLASDAKLAQAVRAMNKDARVQVILLDGEGKPIVVPDTQPATLPVR